MLIKKISVVCQLCINYVIMHNYHYCKPSGVLISHCLFLYDTTYVGPEGAGGGMGELFWRDGGRSAFSWRELRRTARDAG